MDGYPKIYNPQLWLYYQKCYSKAIYQALIAYYPRTGQKVCVQYGGVVGGCGGVFSLARAEQ